ncbi:hypothetical protein Q7P37_003075 [Cladosporium fusiforme]
MNAAANGLVQMKVTIDTMEEDVCIAKVMKCLACQVVRLEAHAMLQRFIWLSIMNYPVCPQPPEHHQQNRWNINYGVGEWEKYGPGRTYPREEPFIEYVPQYGWWQGNKKLRHFKPKYYWTRPNDGKRTGSWGRLKDALTSQGPDVFVTITGDKRTLMRDRPRKDQWTMWPETIDKFLERQYLDMDAIPAEFMGSLEASWTKSSSRAGGRYNFRTRRYEPPQMGWNNNPRRTWRDAQWRPGAKTSATNPLNHQTADGVWWSRIPWSAGDFGGGRPKFP